MSKEWTHSMCEDCWNKRNPQRRAVKMIKGDNEHCCFCGIAHHSGIYVRYNPASEELKCLGEHYVEEQ